MVKQFFIFGLGLVSGVAIAQVKKQFSVESKEEFEKVELCIKAKTGNCFIRPSQNSEILNVYSNQDIENYSHTLSNIIKNKVCHVDLALKQEINHGFGEKISFQMIGGEAKNPSDKFWKIYLTEYKPYALELNYGLGNANIDLSGLAIQKIKIMTASADVNVSYSAGMENKVTMDTFFVKVDMGSLSVKHLNLSKSKTIIAEVGFGNILLDLSDNPLVRYHVEGSVGAGNLTILMPDDDVPVLIKMTESWLCSVDIPKNLKKISSNTFANNTYLTNPKDPITFNLDVSMGKITFKEK